MVTPRCPKWNQFTYVFVSNVDNWQVTSAGAAWLL